jgi:CBS domain-containing protein
MVSAGVAGLVDRANDRAVRLRRINAFAGARQPNGVDRVRWAGLRTATCGRRVKVSGIDPGGPEGIPLMKVAYLYTPNLVSCRASDTLAGAARVLARAGVGALPVLGEDGRLVGIISERDLVRALAQRADPRSSTVDAYASRAVRVAEPGDDSWVVGRRMLDAGIRHLPVVADGRLVGMLSMRDVLAVETWA